MSPWKVLDHPADLAIEGRGRTPEAALAAVIDGLLAQLGPAIVATGAWEEFSVCGFDRYECLVSALNEVLYRIHVDGCWFSTPEVLELGESGIVLRVRGGPRPADTPLETEVKAATYHDLELAPAEGGGWRLRVVFDL